MDEPPDPGGTIPPAGSYVTILTSNTLQSNESSMDTDCSVSQRKRVRTIKLCKHKRKKNNAGTEQAKSECKCSDHEISNMPSLPTSAANVSVDNIPNSSPLDQTNQHPVRNAYMNTDIGPYIVHIQRTQDNPNDNVTLHPVSFGMLLKKKLPSTILDSIINGSVKRIGRNKLSLSFRNYEAANIFLSNQTLVNNKLKAFIPTFNVTRMGIVRGVPNEWTQEEIMENIVVPNGCGKIIKVRRINYKVITDGTINWKATQSVVVTFDGQILPSRVYCCLSSLPVDLYVYPTVQCYNCCRFGHTKIACRSKPRCYKCGQEHTGETCSIDEESISCCLCSGLHFATSKSCPEYNRQKQIKMMMAEKSMSYMEASKIYPAVTKSYADVLASTPKKTINYDTILQPQPLSSGTTSYKKAVVARPRIPYKSQSQGYDRVAHQNLTKEYNVPNPHNGCAISNNKSSVEQKSVTEIIIALINLLTHSNNILPSNAASVLESITSLIVNNNYGQQQAHSGSMELQKCD